MDEWGNRYTEILLRSGLRVWWIRGYVDDGRQATSRMKMGTRYMKEKKLFKVTEEGLKEDEEKRTGTGETGSQRMARVCLPCMNYINEDLAFTVECEDHFPEKRLPTLDFYLWVVGGLLLWSYFEKSLRSQLMIMKRSAQGEQQKMDILSNELIRRMSNVCEDIDPSEKIAIVDHYTKQLKNSGYSWLQAKEVVTCGLEGFRNKCERRKKEGGNFYRNAKQTLGKRVKKKLLEKTSWFKDKKRENDEHNDEMKENLPSEEQHGSNRNRQEKIKIKAKAPENGGNKVKSVIFVPHTPGSSLAKDMREGEIMLEKTTGYKLEIVERAGDSLEVLLHRSNPWSAADWAREMCLLCESKQTHSRKENQNCKKRNVVYETWCETCREEEEGKLGENNKKEIKLFKYVGESARSSHERGVEHQQDCEQLKPGSHMLKHILDKHAGKQPGDIKSI